MVFTALQAQAAYRCGNVYQDRPCNNADEQSRLSPSGVRITPAKPKEAAATPPAAPARPAVDPNAQKAAKAAEAAAKAAVATPPKAAPVPAATAPAPVAAPAPAPVAAPAAVPAPAVAARPAAAATGIENRALAASNLKARCAGLGVQLDNLQASARAGGSAADMEKLAQQRRTLQKNLSDAGC